MMVHAGFYGSGFLNSGILVLAAIGQKFGLALVEGRSH